MMELKLDDLENQYSEDDEADQEVFAEARSNLLLISGEHYSKARLRFNNQVRDSRELNQEQKLRLTKNHIQRIVKHYIANIHMHAPSVTIIPKNENELQDQKSAELHQAVWMDAKDKYKLKKRTREWLSDFIGIGECWVKIFWDPMAGKFMGYEQDVGDDGTPMVDEQGEMKASDRPVFSGDFSFERIFGFNLLRQKDAKSFDESPYLTIRKMAYIDDMKKRVGSDPEKLKALEPTADETYHIFDPASGSYSKSKNQVLIKERYYRPGKEFPQGYFVIWTTNGKLWEGELPFGIFPLVGDTFEEFQTSPRGRSVVKQLRPYQVEVNRAASKMAEHQITLGDDKVLIQHGTKLVQGGVLPGVRGIQYQGMPPTILAGRDGTQYLEYMNSQIAEMYQVAMIEEDAAEKGGQIDPFAMLFRSSRQKKRFSIYAEKFEQFLISMCETYLDLAKRYLPDDTLIPAVGRREYINISEFRNQEKLCYQIKIEAQNEDLETKMGKQLVLNHALQYVGNKMEREDIGKLMRAMPYGNFEESFGDFTLDYDNATNMILALDRGEEPFLSDSDDPKYMLKRLTNRMRQADYRMLDPQIQQAYTMVTEQYKEIEAMQMAKILAAESEYIPTGGYLVSSDLYVADAADPKKTKRVRLPSEAMEWLIQRMEAQGTGLQRMENMSQGAQADIAGMISQKQLLGAPNGMGASGNRGQASPGGIRDVGTNSQPVFPSSSVNERAINRSATGGANLPGGSGGGASFYSGL